MNSATEKLLHGRNLDHGYFQQKQVACSDVCANKLKIIAFV